MLDIWDRGQGQSPSERALSLLVATCSESSPDELANLSLGQRDARLIALRELTFGSHLVGLVSCAVCNQRLEMSFKTLDVQQGAKNTPPQPLSLDAGGYRVSFRLPNSTDLSAVSSAEDAPTARQMLLERCITSAEHHGQPLTSDGLPREIEEMVEEQMSEADPQGNIQLALSCPQCGHHWHAPLDIASFFWREIHAWATRILHEVHLLASAYGWTETEILALSPRRRQLYLSMVAA